MWQTFLTRLTKPQGCDHIYLCTHRAPDADTLGAAVALAHLLRRHGAAVSLVAADGVPARYRGITEGERILSLADLAGQDITRAALVLVDTGDWQYAGIPAQLVAGAALRLAVDHHEQPPDAEGIWAPHALSTSGLLFTLWEAAGEPLSEAVRRLLFLGHCADMFDSGETQLPPRDEVSRRMLARMAGPEAAVALADQLLRKQHPAARALSESLVAGARLEPHIAWIFVPHAALSQIQAEGDALDGLPALLFREAGRPVAVVVREFSPGRFKVSLRSAGRPDVAAIARLFGGGGHSHSAGFFQDSAEGPVERLVAAIREQVARHLKSP